MLKSFVIAAGAAALIGGCSRSAPASPAKRSTEAATRPSSAPTTRPVQLRGNPPLCPFWAFQPWAWEDNGNTQASTLKLIEDYQAHDIPVGAIIIDSPWTTSYNDFNWDAKRYPQPQQMLDTLHQRGVRVVMWMTGMVNAESPDVPLKRSPLLDEVLQRGYAINDGQIMQWWKGKGAHIDFTNPQAKEWWFSQMEKARKMGVDGWKVDNSDDRVTDPVRASTGVLKKTEFKVEYYSAMAEYAQRSDGLIICRPYSHQGGYSSATDSCIAGWCGDFSGNWQGIQDQLHDVYQSAEGGYGALAIEVGGYWKEGASKKQLIRYAEMGAMFPVMVNGGENGGLTNHLPWFHDQETTDIYRYWATLHAELAPYNFSSVVDAHLGGGSPVRQPDLKRRQHLLGRDILVGLVTDDKDRKSVYLPEGSRWIDFWDPTKVHDGGKMIECDAPLARIPLFIRAGAIIPMHVKNDLTGHGDAASAGKETIAIYPSGKSEIVYHCPTGAGTKYEDVRIVVDDESRSVAISGPTAREYRLLIRGEKPQQIDRRGDKFTVSYE